jgi:hypothetical protein
MIFGSDGKYWPQNTTPFTWRGSIWGPNHDSVAPPDRGTKMADLFRFLLLKSFLLNSEICFLIVMDFDFFFFLVFIFRKGGLKITPTMVV